MTLLQPLKKKKVIIFDDDEDILNICAYVLKEAGWEIHIFPDCNSIIDTVRRIAPDAIMMDNRIPDHGGIAATRTLKSTADLRDIPVVYFSANSDIHTLANQAGAVAYLAKPFDLDVLEKILHSVTYR